jgi:predicted dehydrogenase
MKDFLNKEMLKKRKGMALDASKRKGVGVIGLHEGRTLLIGLNRAVFAKAAAGCDLDTKKVEAVKAELPELFYTTKYEEMLKRKDVDIVAIFTPDSVHGENIVAAFKANKDVICTKPIVNSMQDAKKILKAAKQTGRKLFVGQSTRFFESFQRQRLAFERGEVGNLEFVDSHYIHRMDWFYEKSPWAATETDWIFLGMSHPIDLLCWYLGPLEEVQAYGFRSSLGKSYNLKGFDIYTVNVRSKNGKIGRAFGHYGLHELASARNAIELVLFGEKKTTLAQYHDMKYKYNAEDGTEVCEDSLYAYRHYYFNSEVHGMHFGEFANYTDYFAQALIKDKPYSPDLIEGIETFCVMEAVRRSAQQAGRPVQLSPVLKEAGF